MSYFLLLCPLEQKMCYGILVQFLSSAQTLRPLLLDGSRVVLPDVGLLWLVGWCFLPSLPAFYPYCLANWHAWFTWSLVALFPGQSIIWSISLVSFYSFDPLWSSHFECLTRLPGVLPSQMDCVLIFLGDGGMMRMLHVATTHCLCSDAEDPGRHELVGFKSPGRVKRTLKDLVAPRTKEENDKKLLHCMQWPVHSQTGSRSTIHQGIRELDRPMINI